MDNAPEAPQQGLLHLPDALLRRIALLLNPLDRWDAGMYAAAERPKPTAASPAARRRSPPVALAIAVVGCCPSISFSATHLYMPATAYAQQ